MTDETTDGPELVYSREGLPIGATVPGDELAQLMLPLVARPEDAQTKAEQAAAEQAAADAAAAAAAAAQPPADDDEAAEADELAQAQAKIAELQAQLDAASSSTNAAPPAPGVEG